MVAREHVQRHPKACLQVEEAAPQELLTRLVIGEIDLIFGYTDLPAPDHPLAGRDETGPADLARYDWVDSTPDSQRHAALLSLFSHHPLPRLRLITKAPPLMAQMIAGGTALGLMIRIACARRRDWQPDAARADLLQRARHYFATRHAG